MDAIGDRDATLRRSGATLMEMGFIRAKQKGAIVF